MMLLNLTSPSVHASLKTRAYIALVRTSFVTLAIAVVCFIASALVGGTLLQQKVQKAQLEADRSALLLNTQGKASISETTKRLNTQVGVLQKVQKRYIQWSPYIAKFSKLTPPGITLQSLNFTQSSGELTFSATAATRDNYVQYETILQKSGLFKNVELPLQTKKTDIAFSYTVELIDIPKP